MTEIQPAAGIPGAAPGNAPFGRMLTAMVTPITSAGALDVDGAARLATHLVDDMRNDGLVISGTTGESPTTSDAEKDRLLRAVIEAVGGPRHRAGRGRHLRHRAQPSSWPQTAEKAGAARPAGRDARTTTSRRRTGWWPTSRAVADATDLPVMLYDIPGRTGTPIADRDACSGSPSTRAIVAVKDAKGDSGAGVADDGGHRSGVLLRRRHAQPAAAVGRRGRVRQRGRARAGARAARDDRRVPGRRRDRRARHRTTSCCRSTPASSAPRE